MSGWDWALAVCVLASAAYAAVCVLGARRRTRHEDQALNLTKPPAPGVQAPGRAPGPAPRHGGISYSVRVWRCGRIRVWNGDGSLTYHNDCACPHPDPWDSALERLARDLRN